MMAAKLTRLALGAVLCASFVFAQGPRGFGPGGSAPARFGRPGGRGDIAPIAGSPYSATETWTTTTTLADGNTISRTTSTVQYRDGQGRTRTEETVPADAVTGRPARTRITIVDPVAGQRHELDSAAKTDFVTTFRARTGATIGPATPRPNRPARASSQPSAERVELGLQAVNGIAATGRRETQTIPVGRVGNTQPITVTRETWISDSLKRPVKTITTDPRNGTREMELTNIIQSEPDPSLFTVPPGYTATSGRGAGPMRRGPTPR